MDNNGKVRGFCMAADEQTASLEILEQQQALDEPVAALDEDGMFWPCMGYIGGMVEN
jgi:hypothetical protein